MVSEFYNVLNDSVIDSSIKPKGTVRNMCSKKHIAYAGENDLIVYERAYNAFWLCALHIKQIHAICMRTKAKKDLVIKAVVESNKKEAVVIFEPNKYTVNACQKKACRSLDKTQINPCRSG